MDESRFIVTLAPCEGCRRSHPFVFTERIDGANGEGPSESRFLPTSESRAAERRAAGPNGVERPSHERAPKGQAVAESLPSSGPSGGVERYGFPTGPLLSPPHDRGGGDEIAGR